MKVTNRSPANAIKRANSLGFVLPEPLDFNVLNEVPDLENRAFSELSCISDSLSLSLSSFFFPFLGAMITIWSCFLEFSAVFDEWKETRVREIPMVPSLSCRVHWSTTRKNNGRDPFNQNSNRCDREKRTTSKGGPVFSKLFRLDRTDPLSFGPKFPEILVEWIAPNAPCSFK